MNKAIKRLFVLVLTMVLLVSPLYVCASEIDATLQTVKNSGYLSELCSQSNVAAGATILTYDAGSGLLRFNNREYKKLSVEKREEFMETALTYVSKIPNTASSKMKNSVYNFIEQQDQAVTAAMKYLQVNAGADLAEAEKWFSVISDFISVVLGFFCILIFMFLGFSIVFDISYIVIPPFQAMLDSSADGVKKPWGVSKEAYMSMQEAEKSDKYKNVLSLYFGRRAKVLIIVALAIAVLWLPMSFGIEAVIIFVAIAFVAYGISTISLAYRLWEVHRHAKALGSDE
jgi:hypothetical protein